MNRKQYIKDLADEYFEKARSKNPFTILGELHASDDYPDWVYTEKHERRFLNRIDKLVINDFLDLIETTSKELEQKMRRLSPPSYSKEFVTEYVYSSLSHFEMPLELKEKYKSSLGTSRMFRQIIIKILVGKLNGGGN